MSGRRASVFRRLRYAGLWVALGLGLLAFPLLGETGMPVWYWVIAGIAVCSIGLVSFFVARLRVYLQTSAPAWGRCRPEEFADPEDLLAVEAARVLAECRRAARQPGFLAVEESRDPRARPFVSTIGERQYGFIPVWIRARVEGAVVCAEGFCVAAFAGAAWSGTGAVLLGPPDAAEEELGRLLREAASQDAEPASGASRGADP